MLKWLKELYFGIFYDEKRLYDATELAKLGSALAEYGAAADPFNPKNIELRRRAQIVAKNKINGMLRIHSYEKAV